MSPRPGSLADRLATTTTVVVVEDEPDIAAFLGAFFRASGVGLAHVNPVSAADALEAIASHDPACVLLDINLAGFSGLDVLAEIRADARLRAVPVVVVSADSSAATVDEAHRLGVSDYVAKPFSVSELFDQVARLIEGPSAAPGLIARAELDDRLTRLIRKASQNEEPMSFALIRAGDDSDDRVVAALRAALPSDAVFGPGDDDEIAVIVPGSDARTTTGTLADVLAGVFATARAGVATAPDHATTGDELYMAADAALAEAVEQDRPVLTAR
jgi:DNA-binding response OmpR family regulator